MLRAIDSQTDCRPNRAAPPRPITGRFWRVFIAANCLAILGTAIFLRVWKLGSIPGINGDEAQYGVFAIQWLRGEPIPLTTNTGNLINPLFMGPQVLLHSLWPASFPLLRATAVLSGLAALAVNFILARRVFGNRTAIVSTLVLAILPTNIAYSRFAWDSCQSLLATLPVVYFSLLSMKEAERRGKWLALAAVSGAAAVLVHPTNLFITPFLGLALVWPYRIPLAQRLDPRGEWRRWLPSWLGLLSIAAAVTALSRNGVGIGSGRMPNFAEAIQFVWNYQRLFSGVTVFRYIPGSQIASPAHFDASSFDILPYDLLACAAFAIALVVWLFTRRQTSAPADGGLVIGWMIGAAAFFMIAGPRAIEPHWERYGLVLIAPGAILLARAMVRFLDRGGLSTSAGGLVCLLGGWMMLAGFHFNYFYFFQTTGGRSQDTFRTAQVEPKLTALRHIAAQRDETAADETAWIVASEWWNYWPIRYLAMRDTRLRVHLGHEVDAMSEFSTALASGRVWFVEFTDSTGHVEIRQRLQDRGYICHEMMIADYAGRPVLSVIRPLGADPLTALELRGTSARLNSTDEVRQSSWVAEQSLRE